MEACDILHLEGNVIELEKGDGVRRPGENNAFKLKFSGIETGVTSRKILENPSLPFALEKENLETV
jgi:hypothetical protein